MSIHCMIKKIVINIASDKNKPSSIVAIVFKPIRVFESEFQYDEFIVELKECFSLRLGGEITVDEKFNCNFFKK